MANTILLKRGLSTNINSVVLAVGELAITTDTNELYVGTSNGNVKLLDLVDYYTKSNVDTLLNNKVDKVSGKQLSTNDYTTIEKNKLQGIEANANNYTLPNSSSTVAGGLKTRLDGTTLYITSNGDNA